MKEPKKKFRDYAAVRKLEQVWDDNPLAVIAAGIAVTTVLTKLIDTTGRVIIKGIEARASNESKRAYANLINKKHK